MTFTHGLRAASLHGFAELPLSEATDFLCIHARHCVMSRLHAPAGLDLAALLIGCREDRLAVGQSLLGERLAVRSGAREHNR